MPLTLRKTRGVIYVHVTLYLVSKPSVKIGLKKGGRAHKWEELSPPSSFSFFTVYVVLFSFHLFLLVGG